MISNLLPPPSAGAAGVPPKRMFRDGLSCLAPRTESRTGPVPVGSVAGLLERGLVFGCRQTLDWSREHPLETAGTVAGLVAAPVLCPHFAGVIAAGVAMKLARTLR